jgi:tRNA dimethylallyltransferase
MSSYNALNSSGPLTILVLAGATASGKSELALDLAEALGAEIVGADSRQVYRRLDVGTAKPTPEERQRVPHHLIDHVEPAEDYQAWRYQAELREALPGIAERGRVPLLVGGTGLYLRAGIEGLSPGAPSDAHLRAALAAELETQGPEKLHQRLAALDPASAARIHPRDRSRIVRLLELCLTSGRPASEHLELHRPEPLPARVVYLGLHWPRAELHARIDRRAREALERGWIAEVQALLAEGVPPGCRAMQSLGYREIVAYLGGGMSRSELLRQIQVRTRRYARRQLTWFRALPLCWLQASRPRAELLQAALDALAPRLQGRVLGTGP